jgi:AcrR family transcriptional regulator
MIAKPYHHGDLRSALIEAAISLLRKGDASSVSLREIAKAAGVSPNAPYRHFESKESLLMAVAERGFRTLVASLRSVQSGAEPIPLEMISKVYFEFAQEFPAEYGVMFGRDKDSMESGYVEASGEAFFILLQTIRSLMNPGATQTQAVPNAIIAWSLIHGYSLLAHQGTFQFVDPSVVPTTDDLARAIAAAIRASLA